MSGQEVAVKKTTALDLPDQAELSGVMEVVRAISATDFVPKGIRGNNAAILACILYGREIGLGPMESLSEVHMIEGRPSLSAKAKVKRARQAGHDIWGVVDENGATVHGKRGDNGREMTVTFTMAQAKTAGLAGKSNWKNYAEDMLWARAVTRLCRRLFTEDGMLTALDPDEAESIADDERVSDALADLPVVDVSDDVLLEGEVVDGLGEEPGGGIVGSGSGAPEASVDSVAAHTPESSSSDSLFTDMAREKGIVE